MGPPSRVERRVIHHRQALQEFRVCIRRQVVGIPTRQIPEYTKPKLPRRFRCKIHPDCSVVIGCIGNLNRVAKPWRKFAIRIQAQPERHRPIPVQCGVGSILRRRIENRVFVTLAKPQSVTKATAFLDDRHSGVPKPGHRLVLLFVGWRRIDLPVPQREISRQTLIE